MGSNHFDHYTSIQFSGNYRIQPCPVVNVYGAGHHSFGYISTAKYDFSLIVDLNYISLVDTPLIGVRGMHPHRFVYVVVRSPDFTGINIMEPVDIIQISRDSPPILASMVTFLFFEEYIAITSLLFLSVADVMAVVIRQKFGRHSLFKESLEASLTGLASFVLIEVVMTQIGIRITLLVVIV